MAVVITLTFALVVACIDAQNQNQVYMTHLTIPEGDYWFQVDFCLDVHLAGERCGWIATLNSSVPLVDAIVFPSAITLTSLNDEDDLSGGSGSGHGAQDTTGDRPNEVTGSEDSFLMTSTQNDTCVRLISVKYELTAVELHTAIHCVCRV